MFLPLPLDKTYPRASPMTVCFCGDVCRRRAQPQTTLFPSQMVLKTSVIFGYVGQDLYSRLCRPKTPFGVSCISPNLLSSPCLVDRQVKRFLSTPARPRSSSICRKIALFVPLSTSLVKTRWIGVPMVTSSTRIRAPTTLTAL